MIDIKHKTELILNLENISVNYRSYSQRPSSLKQTCLKFIREGKYKHYSTFAALTHVSFNLKKGEMLGIIGSNGSGKSTLLKVVSGVLAPTSGVVQCLGSVTSLIELGAGFDGELNAIENIYLNWSLYRKKSAEIKSNIEKIIDFAELQDFREMPIKHYSSGMFARLGFSTAIHLDPEILVVDEIIAVGDEKFQAKCFSEMKNIQSRGKSIIFVSHSMEQITKLCDRAILLERGKITYQGLPEKAVEAYRNPAYSPSLSS
ncbi:MAG: ABC transporter ATP-binding protein [Proteobacteria bacterium]|nr:ABC transporter ATP-binding protein [Pseudomonadota bacterium]